MTHRFIPPATLHRIYGDSPWSNPASFEPEPINDNPPKWFPIMVAIEIGCVGLSIFCLGYFGGQELRAMPSARAFALRVESIFVVSPADAASIAIARSAL